MSRSTGVGTAVRVVARREPDADLIPRAGGGGLALVPRGGEALVRSGLMAGPFLLDLDALGDLVGASTLEDRSQWQRASLDVELRSKPHVLRVLEAPPLVRGEVRWDAERSLAALALDPAALDAGGGTGGSAARVVGLGPRAAALLHGDALVALLADLRGFGK